jgi:hypothetical protein
MDDESLELSDGGGSSDFSDMDDDDLAHLANLMTTTAWVLSCADCSTLVTVRGMSVSLIADQGVQLFSSDEIMPSVAVDEATRREITTCACQIVDMSCGRCARGTVPLGYKVVEACQGCLAGGNNGHYHMFSSPKLAAAPRPEDMELGLADEPMEGGGHGWAVESASDGLHVGEAAKQRADMKKKAAAAAAASGSAGGGGGGAGCVRDDVRAEAREAAELALGLLRSLAGSGEGGSRAAESGEGGSGVSGDGDDETKAGGGRGGEAGEDGAGSVLSRAAAKPSLRGTRPVGGAVGGAPPPSGPSDVCALFDALAAEPPIDHCSRAEYITLAREARARGIPWDKSAALAFGRALKAFQSALLSETGSERGGDDEEDSGGGGGGGGGGSEQTGAAGGGDEGDGTRGGGGDDDDDARDLLWWQE